MTGRTETPFARFALAGGRAIELWNEDALAGLPRRVRSADVVVTSPPYNRGVRYGTYSDRRPRRDYLDWIGRLGEAVERVLAERGSFFLNVGGSPKDPWIPWEVARELGRSFVLQNVVHWVKSIAIDRRAAGAAAGLDRDLALGHYKPLVSERYLHNAQEYIFHFTRRGDVRLDRLAVGVAYQDRSNVRRWKRPRSELRCRGNTWFLPYPTIQARARDRPHPATFPVELPEWCIRLHGVDRTTTVVDPFVGIGSTAVAAARLGTGFVGFDVDAGYLAEAAERIHSELDRAPVPVALRRANVPAREGSRRPTRTRP